ncbi:MAG: single-stranded-DNA-specific exonuclease RecJ [Clostridiales bacterium]|nr:single-stranded-DNA-specific exonuclease RecJ [Clostridiales bacterium]
MKIVYGKNLTKEEIDKISSIASECGILFDTARLLFCRGVDTSDKVKTFLNPGKKWFYNPLLLDGVCDAVNRIKLAKERREKVLIFGDYDADGVSATSVLYYCLKDFGIEASTYIPERDEGYGLSLKTIEQLNQDERIDLIITVDCGISDAEKIKEINLLGIDVIVTDHHEPPLILPDCIKINPKIAGQKYPFTELCGAGVAYKLGYALIGEKANDYLDLVALATVADSMDLLDENRNIVVEGLKIFNDKRKLRLPFKYLLGEINKQVTAQTLAYNVAPRVNAGGRMGDARSALELFIDKNPNTVFDLAVKLGEYNVQRQTECDKIYREAKQKIIQTNADNDGIIMVADQNWRAGFVGIVAAKLVEEYARPVIVFAGHDGFFKGSARSVDGVNIYDAICSAKDILIAYGGHAQAAGVSVSKEDFELLRKKLNEYAQTFSAQVSGEQKLAVEWELTSHAPLQFARELETLEPFGVGNKRPLFSITVGETTSLPLKNGSPHYSYRTNVIEILDFNGEKNVLPLSLPINKKVVFEFNLSTFKNREYLKGYSRYVLPEYDDYKSIAPYVFRNNLVNLISDDESPEVEQIDQILENVNSALYVVSNPENIKFYPQLNNLPVSLFDCTRARGEIVVCPTVIPEDCRRLVYLDKPLQYYKTQAKVSIFKGALSYTLLDRISTDRSDFERIFISLKALSNKSFISTVDFCQKYIVDENLYQAIFVTETFLELGIFSVVNGTFVFNQNVKNALTNSKLYSKIYTLKV